MTEGDISLTVLPQADGQRKNRPVVVLRKMPPFDDWLVCGVSTQLHQAVAGFDDAVHVGDADYTASGLKASSLIRPPRRRPGRQRYLTNCNWPASAGKPMASQNLVQSLSRAEQCVQQRVSFRGERVRDADATPRKPFLKIFGQQQTATRFRQAIHDGRRNQGA